MSGGIMECGRRTDSKDIVKSISPASAFESVVCVDCLLRDVDNEGSFLHLHVILKTRFGEMVQLH